MSTYSQVNARFSDRAHDAALSQLYARMYPAGASVYSLVGTDWDHVYGVDYAIQARAAGLTAPVPVLIAERWRRPYASQWESITVTEWCTDSGRPSEVHKTIAGLFVYGLFDEALNRIQAAYVVNVARMLAALVAGALPFERVPRATNDQTFLDIKVRDLMGVNAVEFRI